MEDNTKLLMFKQLLTKMRVNRKGSFYAPHKPILMISIIDMFDILVVNCSFNNKDAKLNALFHVNWERYVEKDVPFKEDINMAFSHIVNELFCRAGKNNSVILRKDLCEFLQERRNRINLRAAIVNQYFPRCSYKIDFDTIDASDDDSLRDYQVESKEKVYEFLKTNSSVMLQMPTGTGKTRLFVSIVRDFHNWGVKNKKAVKILVLAHRRELIDQIDTELGVKYGLAHGLIMSQSPENKKYPVQVGCVPTMNRRIDDWAEKDFDFIIVDEAHHVKAESYKRIIKEYPNAKLLGLTATPYRLNGAGFKEEFNGLILSEPVNWFIDKRYLCDYIYYSIKPQSVLQSDIDRITKFALDGDYAEDAMMSVMDNDRVQANIIEAYQKYAEGKKGIVYCINKEHNKHVCSRYNEIGVKAAAIDSSTPKEERDKLVEQFKSGKLQVLCNVNIFSEGFDCPDVEFIQLARPTKSLSMYLQQVGRGLRPAEGKENVVFLDNVGLYNKFGFPSARRRWQHHFEGRDVNEPELNEIVGGEHEVRFFEEVEGEEEVHELFSTMSNDTKLNTVMKNYEKEFLEYCDASGMRSGKGYLGSIVNHTDKYIRENIDKTFSSVFNMIDKIELYHLRDLLNKSNDFLNLPANKHHYLTASLNKYIEFAENYSVVSEKPAPLNDEGDGVESGIIGGNDFGTERDELLKEIAVFEKYHSEVPAELIRKLEELNKRCDFKTRLIDLIIDAVAESGFGKEFELYIPKDGAGIRIIDSDKYCDVQKLKELKSEVAIFEKYHRDVPEDVLEEIASMESYESFSSSLPERIRELAEEIGIPHSIRVKVDANGDVSYIDSGIKEPEIRTVGKNSMSKTELCAAKTMYGVLKSLADHGGIMGYKELKSSIPKYADFSDWDLSGTRGNGRVRWEGALLYNYGSYVKAGFLTIDKGNRKWYITSLGRKAIEEGAEEIYKKVIESKNLQNNVRTKENRDTTRLSTREKLTVVFPDGDVISHSNVKKTFVETIVKIGAEKVASVGLEVAYFPLVGKSRPEAEHFTEVDVPEIEPGWFLNTHTSTTQKKQLLQSIDEALKLGLKIESYFVEKKDGALQLDLSC